MGGIKYCPVRGCPSVKPEKQFFHVPADLEMRYKWMRLCGFGSIGKKSSICELHFVDDDFYNNEGGRKKIRRKVLPSKNLPSDAGAVLGTQWTSHTYATKPVTILDERTGKTVVRNVPFQSNIESDLVAKLQQQLFETRSEKLGLLRKVKNLKMQNSKLRKHALLKKDLFGLFQKYLGKSFTDTQIKAYIRGEWKLIRNWTGEDFKRARILRLISKRAYQYLRKSGILPLPSLTTLYKASPNGLASSELQELISKYDVEDDQIERALEADVGCAQSDAAAPPEVTTIVIPAHYIQHVDHIQFVDQNQVPIIIAEAVSEADVTAEEGGEDVPGPVEGVVETMPET